MNSRANVFLIPSVQLIHCLGHLADGYLFAYLVGGFFRPRKGTVVPTRQTVWATVFFAAALFAADHISHNSFWVYYAMIFLLPLLYSCIFFGGSILSKLIICSIFTSLVFSFEFFVIAFPWASAVTWESSHALYLTVFFIRRVGVKALLYLIIRYLFRWQGEANISLPIPCWLLVLAISVGDDMMLAVLRVPLCLPEKYEQLFALVFLTLIPVLLLLILKYLALVFERNRIVSSQMAEARIQNQYLNQQLDMSESLRRFRHDYKAHLFAMDTLLEAGKYDELHQYLLSLHRYQFEGTHLKQFTDDPSLNILLNQKATVAERYGIRFDADIYLPTKGKVSISDLNSLLVNLCDNAIEACATLKNAAITLSVQRTKAYLLIDITNSCGSNVLKENPSFRTHKSNPDYHGMGIKIIREIVSRYSGTYEVSATDSTFTTNIALTDE